MGPSHAGKLRLLSAEAVARRCDMESGMQNDLDSDVYQLLARQVGVGRFPSVEAAIAALARDDALREAELDAVDLSWAKPYVDAGLKDVTEGRTRPAAAIHAALSARFRTPS
jgi:hypothetical protein